MHGVMPAFLRRHPHACHACAHPRLRHRHHLIHRVCRALPPPLPRAGMAPAAAGEDLYAAGAPAPALVDAEAASQSTAADSAVAAAVVAALWEEHQRLRAQLAHITAESTAHAASATAERLADALGADGRGP